MDHGLKLTNPMPAGRYRGIARVEVVGGISFHECKLAKYKRAPA